MSRSQPLFLLAAGLTAFATPGVAAVPDVLAFVQTNCMMCSRLRRQDRLESRSAGKIARPTFQLPVAD
jgi:hypothetical protein